MNNQILDQIFRVICSSQIYNYAIDEAFSQMMSYILQFSYQIRFSSKLTQISVKFWVRVGDAFKLVINGAKWWKIVVLGSIGFGSINLMLQLDKLFTKLNNTSKNGNHGLMDQVDSWSTCSLIRRVFVEFESDFYMPLGGKRGKTAGILIYVCSNSCTFEWTWFVLYNG